MPPKKTGGKAKAAASAAPPPAELPQQRVLQTRSQKDGLPVSLFFRAPLHHLPCRHTFMRVS